MEKHTKLQVEYYPIAVCTENDKDIYWNVYTGEYNAELKCVQEQGKKYNIFYFPEDISDTNMEKSFIKGLSIQYDEEREQVCLLYCILNLFPGYKKRRMPRKWEVCERLYITKDGRILGRKNKHGKLIGKHLNTRIYQWIVAEKKSQIVCYDDGDYQDVYEYCFFEKMERAANPKIMLINKEASDEHYLSGNPLRTDYAYMEPFRRLWGNFLYCANENNEYFHFHTICYLMDVDVYLANLRQPMKEGIQRSYLNLPAVEIPETVKNLKGNVIKTDSFRYFSTITKQENKSIIRVFAMNNIDDDFYIENHRIVVTEDEAWEEIAGREGFIRLGKVYFPYQQNIYLEYKKEDIMGTPLERYADIIERTKKEFRFFMVYMLALYPAIEKLYRIDILEDVAEGAAVFMPFIMPDKNLKIIFGMENNYFAEKDKGVYEMTGLNKYQIEKLMPAIVEDYDIKSKNFTAYSTKMPSMFHISNSPVFFFKVLVSVLMNDTENNVYLEDVRSLDNETTDLLCLFIEEMIKNFTHESLEEQYFQRLGYELDEYMEELFIDNRMSNFIYDILNILWTLMKYETKDGIKKVIRNMIDCPEVFGDLQCYFDTLEGSYHLFPDFKPFFDNVNDVYFMHNCMTREQNRRKLEFTLQEKKRWTDLIPSWEKWRFQKDGLAIVLPESPDAIVKEGIELNHCVGRYIDRVMKQQTNIVFIRKEDALEESFFTVEIDPYNEVVQIHGRNNCNATDRVRKFVKDWSKECGLRVCYYDSVR